MAPIFALLAITSFFLLASPVLSALPNVTAIQIGAGDCSGYPFQYIHSTVNADAFSFVADQVDTSTTNLNISLNGLAASVSYGSTLFIYPNISTSPNPTIFCCDHEGTVEDGFGFQSLLFSIENSTQDEVLAFSNQGSKPETYVHELNGTRLDGVFLGKGNVTTWGFRRVEGEDYYWARLLVKGRNEVLYDGEVEGFLKAVEPPLPTAPA